MEGDKGEQEVSSGKTGSDDAPDNPDSSSVRDAQVTTAVKFLSDARVKSAPSVKAAAFLRNKGLSPAEINAAFHRVGREPPAEAQVASAAKATPVRATAFASPVVAPLPASHQHQQLIVLPHGSRIELPGDIRAAAVAVAPPPVVPVVDLSRGRRPVWANAVVGVAAFTGVAMLLRELLKKYVVPLYFPDEGLVDSREQHAQEREQHRKELAEEREDQKRERYSEMEAMAETINRIQRDSDAQIGTITKRMAQAEARERAAVVTVARLEREVKTLETRIPVTEAVRGGGVGRILGGGMTAVTGSAGASDSVQGTPPSAAVGGSALGKVNNRSATAGYTFGNIDRGEDDFMSMAPATVETFRGQGALPGVTRHNNSSSGDRSDAGAGCENRSSNLSKAQPGPVPGPRLPAHQVGAPPLVGTAGGSGVVSGDESAGEGCEGIGLDGDEITA